MWWQYPLLIVGSYLLGSTPVGLLIGRWVRGVDIRDFGSGKIGFTNSLRTLGLGPSLAVFAGDILKGALPVLVASHLSPHPELQVAAATGAVIGHVLPIFAGFKGGRGVATSWGATLAMMAPVALLLIPVVAALAYLYRYMSLASIAGTTIGALIVWISVATGHAPLAFGLWGLIATAIILVSHRENLERLRNGNEPKIGAGGQRRPHTGSANP